MEYKPRANKFTSREDAKHFIRDLNDTYSITIDYDKELKEYTCTFWSHLFEGESRSLVQENVDNYINFCEKDLHEDPTKITVEVYAEEFDKLNEL